MFYNKPMISIQKINSSQTQSKPLLTPKNTGYIAGAAMLVTTARVFTKTKSIAKTHKAWGLVTAGLTLLHVGVVEYLHHKYKRM